MDWARLTRVTIKPHVPKIPAGQGCEVISGGIQIIGVDVKSRLFVRSPGAVIRLRRYCDVEAVPRENMRQISRALSEMGIQMMKFDGRVETIVIDRAENRPEN